MKPKIAIFASVDAERAGAVLHTYVHAIEESGGLPLLIPYMKHTEFLDEITDLCDGFLFTGGGDADPTLYGEKILPECGKIEPLRDAWDFAAAARALESGKPIMGICRGIQVLNVALGGTLYQDIPSQYKTDILHSQTNGLHAYSHSVQIVKDTPLHALTESDKIPANSFHHQSIKDLGRGLVPMAYAPDGIIEAVYSQELPYLRGYQWHPERLFDADEHHKKIFSDFITACKEN